MHFTIQIDEYFSIKWYFRANLNIDVTKNRIFWGISLVKSKSEIHSPGNFLLISPIADVLFVFPSSSRLFSFSNRSFLSLHTGDSEYLKRREYKSPKIIIR